MNDPIWPESDYPSEEDEKAFRGYALRLILVAVAVGLAAMAVEAWWPQ